jgi:hypothetical protein
MKMFQDIGSGDPRLFLRGAGEVVVLIGIVALVCLLVRALIGAGHEELDPTRSAILWGIVVIAAVAAGLLYFFFPPGL